MKRYTVAAFRSEAARAMWHMNVARYFLFLVSIALGATVLAAGPALADATILKYDKQGRVIDSDEIKSKKDTKGATGAPTGSRTKGKARRTPASTGRQKSGESIKMKTIPNPNDQYEKGEVMVLGDPEKMEDKLKSLGFTIIEKVPMAELGLTAIQLKIPKRMSERQALSILRSNFPNIIADMHTVFDLLQGKPASSDAVFAHKLVGWGRVPATCGRGVKIGMIDTLPDTTHPTLKGQKITTANFVSKKKKPVKSDHGTAIASLLVGKPYRGNVGGLLPGATLFAGGIFERRKDGKLRSNLQAFLKAINWLTLSKVRVVNLSIAGSKNKVLTKVARESVKSGMILVAAAGNAGPGAKPAYPAAYNQVVSVTALDRRKKIYRHANRGRYIDFAAPGVAIWTAGKGGGKLRSGTSFAVPFITSLTALLIHGGFKPDPNAIRSRLRRYVQDLGKPGKDNDYGLGMVRVRAPC